MYTRKTQTFSILKMESNMTSIVTVSIKGDVLFNQVRIANKMEFVEFVCFLLFSMQIKKSLDEKDISTLTWKPTHYHVVVNIFINLYKSPSQKQ